MNGSGEDKTVLWITSNEQSCDSQEEIGLDIFTREGSSAIDSGGVIRLESRSSSSQSVLGINIAESDNTVMIKEGGKVEWKRGNIGGVPGSELYFQPGSSLAFESSSISEGCSTQTSLRRVVGPLTLSIATNDVFEEITDAIILEIRNGGALIIREQADFVLQNNNRDLRDAVLLVRNSTLLLQDDANLVLNEVFLLTTSSRIVIKDNASLTHIGFAQAHNAILLSDNGHFRISFSEFSFTGFLRMTDNSTIQVSEFGFITFGAGIARIEDDSAIVMNNGLVEIPGVLTFSQNARFDGYLAALRIISLNYCESTEIITCVCECGGQVSEVSCERDVEGLSFCWFGCLERSCTSGDSNCESDCSLSSCSSKCQTDDILMTSGTMELFDNAKINTSIGLLFVVGDAMLYNQSNIVATTTIIEIAGGTLSFFHESLLQASNSNFTVSGTFSLDDQARILLKNTDLVIQEGIQCSVDVVASDCIVECETGTRRIDCSLHGGTVAGCAAIGFFDLCFDDEGQPDFACMDTCSSPLCTTSCPLTDGPIVRGILTMNGNSSLQTTDASQTVLNKGGQLFLSDDSSIFLKGNSILLLVEGEVGMRDSARMTLSSSIITIDQGTLALVDDAIIDLVSFGAVSLELGTIRLSNDSKLLSSRESAFFLTSGIISVTERSSALFNQSQVVLSSALFNQSDSSSVSYTSSNLIIDGGMFLNDQSRLTMNRSILEVNGFVQVLDASQFSLTSGSLSIQGFLILRDQANASIENGQLTVGTLSVCTGQTTFDSCPCTCTQGSYVQECEEGSTTASNCIYECYLNECGPFDADCLLSCEPDLCEISCGEGEDEIIEQEGIFDITDDVKLSFFNAVVLIEGIMNVTENVEVLSYGTAVIAVNGVLLVNNRSRMLFEPPSFLFVPNGLMEMNDQSLMSLNGGEVTVDGGGFIMNNNSLVVMQSGSLSVTSGFASLSDSATVLLSQSAFSVIGEASYNGTSKFLMNNGTSTIDGVMLFNDHSNMTVYNTSFVNIGGLLRLQDDSRVSVVNRSVIVVEAINICLEDSSLSQCTCECSLMNTFDCVDDNAYNCVFDCWNDLCSEMSGCELCDVRRSSCTYQCANDLEISTGSLEVGGSSQFVVDTQSFVGVSTGNLLVSDTASLIIQSSALFVSHEIEGLNNKKRGVVLNVMDTMQDEHLQEYRSRRSVNVIFADDDDDEGTDQREGEESNDVTLDGVPIGSVFVRGDALVLLNNSLAIVSGDMQLSDSATLFLSENSNLTITGGDLILRNFSHLVVTSSLVSVQTGTIVLDRFATLSIDDNSQVINKGQLVIGGPVACPLGNLIRVDSDGIFMLSNTIQIQPTFDASSQRDPGQLQNSGFIDMCNTEGGSVILPTLNSGTLKVCRSKEILFSNLTSSGMLDLSDANITVETPLMLESSSVMQGTSIINANVMNDGTITHSSERGTRLQVGGLFKQGREGAYEPIIVDPDDDEANSVIDINGVAELDGDIYICLADFSGGSGKRIEVMRFNERVGEFRNVRVECTERQKRSLRLMHSRRTGRSLEEIGEVAQSGCDADIENNQRNIAVLLSGCGVEQDTEYWIYVGLSGGLATLVFIIAIIIMILYVTSTNFRRLFAGKEAKRLQKLRRERRRQMMAQDLEDQEAVAL